MSEGKYRYLIKNFGILTLSNFGSKILSFVLIPLYTSVLTTAEYGVYDIYATTVSLALPILTLNISSAVIRFSLDKSNDPKRVFSIGLRRIIIAGLIFCLLIILNWRLGLIEVLAEYPQYLCMYMLSYMIYDLTSQFARGMEDVKGIAIAGIINSVIMLALNIYFLKVLYIGLDGYFLANCFAYIFPCVFLITRLHVWKYVSLRSIENSESIRKGKRIDGRNNSSDIIDAKSAGKDNNWSASYTRNKLFNLRHRNSTLELEMTAYSKPLVFNSIAWWINNASDRYVVTLLCGVAANGVYSLAYKMPSILNIVQTIFSEAWTLSAVKEFDEKNAQFYKNTYSTYNAGMVIICSALILGDRILAKMLFANEFYRAWKYAPWLMISVVFGSLSGVLGGIFTASKKTKITAQTTIVGASVNTVLNFLLVSFVGPVGAAIATLISYVLVWIGRYRAANRIIKMNINLKRDIVSYVVLIIQAILMSAITETFGYVLQVVIFAIIIAAYYKDGISILKKLLKKE